MAFKHYDVTIGAAATQVSSTKTPVQWLFIHNTAQNSAIYIGSSTVTASSYGHTLAASEEVPIGPGTAGYPINLDEVYIFGTENDVVHVLAIT